MENTGVKEDLELKEIGNFTGTEAYQKIWMGVIGTDGIAYVMRNGYSWAVTDACVILKREPKVMSEEFVVVKLRLLPDKKAEIVYDDGNGNILYTQKYEYTTAKRELRMYYTDGVLMLSGEY